MLAYDCHHEHQGNSNASPVKLPFKSLYLLKFMELLIVVLAIIPLNSCSKKSDDGGGNNPPVVYEAQVNILATENHQTIEGFGCATAFNPPNTTDLTSDEFDRLFNSGNGQVGLNFLRIRIASDDAWRATELAHAKAAIQRGAQII